MSSLKTSELTIIVNKALKQDGRLRKGNNLTYHCPFCHHRKRKLEVCLDEPQYWHCWVCDAKGRGLFSLLKKAKSPQDLLSKLESILGMSARKDFGTSLKSNIIRLLNGQEEYVEEEAIDLPYDFRSLAYDDGSVEYKIAKNYAKKRKLTLCDIVKYNIGYCTKGEFANRLVFPSYDGNNSLNFYSCRSYYDDGMKYKNSRVSKNIIGFENMIDFDYPIYLCEGALDAIAIKRNAIPLFGKTLSQKLKTAIITSKCPEVNIVLDDDALNSALRIATFIGTLGKKAKVVRLQGKDPNVLGFETAIKQVKNTDVLDFGTLTRLRLGK
jgi:DNA primase